MTDFEGHLTRQIVFSRANFGPGSRTEGVCDHITKELREVVAAGCEESRSQEWVDVAILALDGLTRSIGARNPDWSSTDVAKIAVMMILAKQGKNERRTWPDWRTMSADKAIEHQRGHED